LQPLIQQYLDLDGQIKRLDDKSESTENKHGSSHKGRHRCIE